ncbi:periplasmic chaperone for outer membrane proteins Skp [Winogradskyella wandonensis]|uniref:Periplasmic chaperone for outer membrane proteins Skp n=1 Tax=Winogradskyella wandonensis TaxID=1442586 RepID=A0A4R1KSG7_9FLAO|nr:OmpH family outer membrane protein [Winogradskyella wandonensis]TCK67537.1 periplasmic chaperone for outer membrane proteins Skp [Winogradskyella wandonensis]
MKFRVLYILAIVGFMSLNAQTVRGARIGYIDTEYILENVPDYQEANAQLEQKLTKWKSEIEKKLADIETKKKALENEKVLLTKELYEERLEDLSFEEAEVLDYQQKRFGPGGDMVIQRTQLMQPVQDQIWAAVKEIAENKKYDFVFDKNADFLMLYSAERFDISEQVLRIITRASAREQAKTKKERKALEEEEAVPEVSKTKDERAKALEERKAQREAELEQKRLDREKALEERRQKQKEAREAKRKEAEARRAKIAEARNKRENPEKAEAEKSADTSASKKTANSTEKGKAAVKSDSTKAKSPKDALEAKRKKALEEREARKKALEERKKKILEQRKKAREERLKQLRKNDSIRKAKAKEKEDN